MKIAGVLYTAFFQARVSMPKKVRIVNDRTGFRAAWDLWKESTH